MIDQPEITRWTAVDETLSPRAFIEYLDAVSSLTGIQRIKQQTFDRLQAGEGDHLLDVGCGAGDDVRALAQLVGNTGRVVGFDVSATMIEEALLRSSSLNCRSSVALVMPKSWISRMRHSLAAGPTESLLIDRTPAAHVHERNEQPVAIAAEELDEAIK